MKLVERMFCVHFFFFHNPHLLSNSQTTYFRVKTKTMLIKLSQKPTLIFDDIGKMFFQFLAKFRVLRSSFVDFFKSWETDKLTKIMKTGRKVHSDYILYP